MDKEYVECCRAFSTGVTNWNEAFQLALALEDVTPANAADRQAAISAVERAFEADVAECVQRIVLMDQEAGMRPLPQHHLCYRDRNVFYRVLPDSRAGRNYVSSLRGVLQSRSRTLTVPLSCAFVFRGIPVLAQALFPLAAEGATAKLHGDGVAAPHPQTAAEVGAISDALNIPLPDSVHLEVYEGLDGRRYVTSTNITTIPLDDGTLVDGPIKRAAMLVLCPCVTASSQDAVDVLRNPDVWRALLDVADNSCDHLEKQLLLCDTLHLYGVNLCLLRHVAYACRGKDKPERYQRLLAVVAVEMLARTVKQQLYLEAQAKQLGMDDVGISKCFALHLKDALDSIPGQHGLMEALMKKYGIIRSEGSADIDILEALGNARQHLRSEIVERVCVLVGARATQTAPDAEGKKAVRWMPLVNARVSSRLSDPSMVQSLSALYRDSARTPESHWYAFCIPVQIKAAMWESRWGDALHLAEASLRNAEQQSGGDAYRVLRAAHTFCHLLFSVSSTESIREGSALLVSLLTRSEPLCDSIARAQLHIDAGRWLLSASAVVPSAADESVLHFQAAEKLLPAFLRGPHGAWLYIQPKMGLLQCRQVMHHPQLIPTQPLAADALSLSKVVTPSDYAVEYLWTLGIELSVDGCYEEATKTLTSAVGLGKKLRITALDINALRSDTLNVYRSWDPQRYSAYCDAVAETL